MQIPKYFGVNDSTPLFYFINCAVSLDSKLSILGETLEISNREDWGIVHNFRNRIVAIVVGANTVKVDDPSLLTKHEYIDEDPLHHPIRVILDPKNKLEGTEKLFQFNESPIILIRSKVMPREIANTIILLLDLSENYKHGSLTLLDQYLQKEGMTGSVMIEGGAGVISSLITHPLVKHMRVFRAPTLVGSAGVDLYSKSELLHVNLQSSQKLGEGHEEIYLLH